MKTFNRWRFQTKGHLSAFCVGLKRTALPFALAACLLTGCGDSKEQEKEDAKSEETGSALTDGADANNSSQETTIVNYTMEDAQNAVKQVNYNKARYTNPSEPDCKINCNGNNVTIDQQGAVFSNGTLTIAKKGTYELSGSLDDGKIIIDVAEDENVNLLFNNFSLSCGDDAAIQVKSANEAMIYMIEGTKNNVSDGSDYYVKATGAQTVSANAEEQSEENKDADESVEDDTPTACIYSTADLTFAGTGQLSVTGNCNDAIKSKDDIIFINGTYEIKAVDDAIVGKDSIAVLDGSFEVTAENDGLKSSKTGDSEKGFVVIEDGKLTIDAGDDGIHAETYFWMENGQIDIVQSYEGYEASIIVINGGTTNITSSDDGINAASGESGMGGGMQGAMRGGRQMPEDGNMGGDPPQMPEGGNENGEKPQMPEGGNENGKRPQISESGNENGERPQMPEDGNMGGDPPQMPEGKNITGEALKAPEDRKMDKERPQMSDEENMTGDPPQNAQEWQRGGNVMTSEGDASTITINGGYIYVNAEGDGLDANNSIYINGGTVLIDGPENNGDGALDYDRECVVSAGILIASGSSGMMQSISSSSEQAGLAFSLGAASTANTTLCLKDQDGATLYTYTPSKKFSSVVISAPELVKGDSYELYGAGAVTGADEHGFGVGVEYSGGQILKELKAE